MQAKGKKGKKGKAVSTSRVAESRQPIHRPANLERSRNEPSTTNKTQYNFNEKRVSFDKSKGELQEVQMAATMTHPLGSQVNVEPSAMRQKLPAAASNKPDTIDVNNLSTRKPSTKVVPINGMPIPDTARSRNYNTSTKKQQQNIAIAPLTGAKGYGVGNSIYSRSPSQRQISYDNEDQSLGSTRPLWKAKYDNNQVYSLEQTFKMADKDVEHMREIKRWNNADIKGRRQTAFIKEVQAKNAKILTVVPQTRLERAHKYTDGHKCLNQRKKIMKCRIYISEFSLTITSSKYFEGFIILVIGLNCITLAGSDSTKEETPVEKNIDLVFNVIYTVEMFLRIFSLGFIWNKGSYLRSMWCQLDFICVMTALMEYAGGGGGSLGALRAFRVLRPLRFVNNIAGLKSIVQSIMSAIPMLKNTMIVLFFFFLIFAIGGLNLFMGMLKQRCVDELTGQSFLDEEGEEMLCGNVECPVGYYCGKKTLNPNYDVTNFDNIFWALLNVFQCVTLEGWSDIMVMYQKTYTPLVILFFVPLVFLGAFFLLNLNLAVIQTKYSIQQQKILEAKERERRELEELTQAAAQQQEAVDEDEDGEGAADALRLGVTEYFIAKRAAQRLLKFYQWKKVKDKRDLENKERAVREAKEAQKAREDEVIRRQASKRRKSLMLSHGKNSFTLGQKPMLKNNSSLRSLNSQDASGNKKSENSGDMDYQEDKDNTQELEDKVAEQQNNLEQERLQKQNENSEICEDEEESYEQAVQDFLNDVNNNAPEGNDPKMFNNIRTRTAKKMAIKGSAYNDVRISGASRNNKLFTSIERTQMPKNQPQMNNIASLNKELMKDKQVKNGGKDEDADVESMHNKILRELDFDKVIVQREFAEDRPPNPETRNELTERKNGNSDFVSDYDHPLDLSFTKDVNEGKRISGPGYASDKQMPGESDDDSISLSNESIQRQLDQLNEKNNNENPFVRTIENSDPKQQRRQMKMQRKESQIKQSDEINKTFRRMLTVGGRNNNDKNKLNETQSTFLGNQPSAKQQIEIFSNFHNGTDVKAIKRQISLAEKEKEKQRDSRTQQNMTSLTNRVSNDKANKDYQDKKERRELIERINREGFFFTERPQHPDEYINVQTEKSAINPGVVYESTSQKEIFEIRNKLRQKEYLNKKNPYIAPPIESEEEGLYEGEKEDTFIQVNFEAYQLKTLYQSVQIDDTGIDSDDEDAVVLQPQPFETAQSIGFENFLSHLPTRDIARRSDIIVSSTLSITLTPKKQQAQNDQQTHFGLVDAEGIWQYVMLRQEYRATFVQSNNLPRAQQRHYQSIDQSSLDSKQIEEEESEFSEFDENGSFESRHESKLGGLVYKMPATLLSEPLDKKYINRMTQKQQRDYMIQKNKFDQKKQKLENRKISNEEKLRLGDDENIIPLPEDFVFDLESAKQLVNGQFKHEDEDDDIIEQKLINTALNGENNNVLGRAMFNGNPNDPQHELKLDAFDQQIANALWDVQHDVFHDPRMDGDHVPNELKEAFSLPKDMSSYDIDFNEVRMDDSNFKKRRPIWSGQDVLPIGITDMKQANWILAKMNLLRVWPKGLFNPIKKVRTVIKDFTRLSIFGAFLTTCVLINTIGMAMDSYDIKAETQANLEEMNLIFTWIFIVEMTLKLLAVGPKKYSSEVMNLLDGGVVTLSIVEMVMSAAGGGSGAGSLQAFRTIRVFRTFRVLRVTRLLRGLQSMTKVIKVIGKSFMDFILITILMFVFIFIYTLLGRQIFQGKYDFGPDAEMPRANYESFSVAFVTVFQVLTMENWQQVLFSSMRASNNNMIFKTVTSIFYISWIFIGNFILLNLFLAILIDAFNEDEEDIDEEEMSDEQKLVLQKKQEAQKKAIKEKRMKKLGTSLNQIRANTVANQELKPKKKKKDQASFTGKKQLRDDDLDDIEDMTSEEIRALLVKNGHLKARPGDGIDKKLVGEEIHAENSIYLFNRHSCFRRNVHFIQKHAYFDRFIMLLIGLSSVKLAMESYFVDSDETSIVLQVSEQLDTVFNHCFNLECVLKILALGFAMDEGSYLRDSWNKLDFFIVVTSNIDMLLSNTDIPALKVLRMLRMIRPLRVISHNPQLKMIVAALGKSVAPIGNVALIVMIIWLMFAIYGMNTYMGTFFYCSEDKYRLNTKWVCEDAGGEWKLYDHNFDDIGQSMITLFIIASLEGWPDIMYQAIDITRRDNGPKYEASPAQSIFFIIFILIGSFFFLNFFIGVLFMEYEKAEKKEKEGFTKEMLDWKELQVLIINAQVPHKLRYKPQEPGLQLKLYNMAESDIFDIAIMACIVLNMLQMALDHEGASPNMLNFLKVTNYIFTTIFLLECILKLYVYRMPYFKTGWNKFDFFVVGSSLIDLGLEMAIPNPEGGQEEESGSQILSVGPQLARVLRVLRVSRVLRLAGKAKGLQALLKTIMMSVDSLFNVFILLMLIFFISAVLGNTMFFQVTEGDSINEFKNFNNFHQSFSLLFSISTGEDWNRIMFDTMRLPPNCIEGKTCGSSIAPVFFLTFIMVVTNVMLNLFILVIIQNFTKYYIFEDNPLTCFENDYEAFIAAWQMFTSRYNCRKIKPKHVPLFLKELDMKMRKRLKILEGIDDAQINKIVLKMNLSVTDDGFIFFNEMLYRLMHAMYVKGGKKPLKLNRTMLVQELVTQYKIAEITYQNQQDKKLSKQETEEVFLKQMNTAPVNLFLTRMFYKTTFKAWHKRVKVYLDRKAHEKNQLKLKERAELKGEKYTLVEYVEIKPKLIEVECEWEEEQVFILGAEEAQQYRDDDDIKSVKSETMKNWTEKSNNGAYESPELFRKHARNRLLSNSKKYPKFIGDEVESSQNRSFGASSKKKRMLIAHSPEEAAAQADYEYVNPNSLEYQNVVMEFKINKYEKHKSRQANVFRPFKSFAHLDEDEKEKMKYKGKFSIDDKRNSTCNNNNNSPIRVNDPLYESRKFKIKKSSVAD